MVILDSEANRFTPFLSIHKHIEAFVSIKAQDERCCKYMFPQGQQEPYHVRKVNCLKGSYPTRTLFTFLPGKELTYILPDMVRKTLLINQCLYLHLKCSQHGLLIFIPHLLF